MDIQDMRIFARVAAVQNLSAVGSELGLTPGTISKRIQALEDELSARLFDRTTRSIRITEEGATFLAHVERILSEIEAARASVDDRVTQAQGQAQDRGAGLPRPPLRGPGAVRVHARVSRDRGAGRHLHDRPVNLQEDGYDVAIRTGTLSDSSLIAKRLAPDRHVIVASPAYLARNGRPLRPEDLANHNCLVLGERLAVVVQQGRRRDAACASAGSLRSNNGELLCHAAARRPRPDPHLRARGAERAARRAGSCRCCPTSRSPPMRPCGRSIPAPSTCCRACACCWISSPTGSAKRAARSARRQARRASPPRPQQRQVRCRRSRAPARRLISARPAG